MQPWIEANGALQKKFQFANFVEALAFVNKVGALAEKLQHHPDISLNYNTVTVSSTTHDAGSTVTEKDRSLAEAVDQLA